MTRRFRGHRRGCVFGSLVSREKSRDCTVQNVCDVIYSAREIAKQPAKKSHAIIQFGLFTYFSICDFTPRKSMVSCNIHGPLVFQPSLMARATAAGAAIFSPSPLCPGMTLDSTRLSLRATGPIVKRTSFVVQECTCLYLHWRGVRGAWDDRTGIIHKRPRTAA